MVRNLQGPCQMPNPMPKGTKMPPRKAPAAPPPEVAETVTANPDAGVTSADHRTAAGMMLRALAGLPPMAALDQLRALYARLPNGTARRAVLAARLAILRDNLPAPVPVAPVVVPEPAPVITKAPPKAGALSTLALEDAARMLMAAAGPEEDETPPAKAQTPAAVADIFAALAAGEDESDTPAQDAWDGFDTPEPEPLARDRIAPETVEADPQSMDGSPTDDAEADQTPAPKPARAKTKPRKAKAAATQADTETGFVAMPPQAMAVSLPDLSALDDLTEAPAPFDLGAAFAALAETDDAPLAPPDDLVRAVAARVSGMDEDDGPAIAPVKPPRPKKAKGGMSEGDIAASLSALIGEGAPAVAATPAMLDPEVADRLTSLETAFAEEAKAKPKRKMPTDLSDVSAAFAALDSDED